MTHYTNTNNPIDFPKQEYIWQAELDGKFHCSVVRINKRGGNLQVVETATGRILLNQDVGLLYGARFGPDLEDVDKWQDICVAVVDRDTKSSI
jgi:hypothetical protein